MRIEFPSHRLLTLLIAFFVCCSICAADSSLSIQSVYRFDAGPVDSVVADDSVALNPDSTYTRESGFGWKQRPQASFTRSDLSRSRTALTIDGVAGNQLAFQIDVPEGAWYVTLWLETEPSDEHWPKIILQDKHRPLHWQKFRPPTEPRRAPQKTYRVYHGLAQVGSKGLSLALTGTIHEARILGLTLIQRIDNSKLAHRNLLRRLKSVANYRTRISGDDFLNLAAGLTSEQHDTDAIYALWQQRLELLANAEQYFSMRGWQWAKQQTGLGMFDRQHQAVMLLDGLLMPDVAESQALVERALFLRGQLLFWLGRQSDGANEIAGGKRDLELLAARHPDDKLLAMYTGKQVDLPDACDCLAADPVNADPAAPDWSISQLEALCRLRQIAHWWVLQRQSDTGEFGGKLGDDVELLRWWAPLCLSGDKTALQGWQRLADGVWQSEHVFQGYARRVADVEHAAEFVADTAPLMAIYSDDPRYTKRLTHSAKHFETLWTGSTAQGNRFFRSAWFSSTAVATKAPKGRDVEYNTRAVQAMRYLARRHPDPHLVKLLHEWSTAWAQAAMRMDKGKPSGIVPASVRFNDEAFNGDAPNWYQANMLWDYYDWEHYAGSLMLDQLLFTYTLTADERLLQPLLKTLELIRANDSKLSPYQAGDWPEGSSAWAATRLSRCQSFWQVVEQWRFLTGDQSWDDLIMRFGTAYGRYRVSRDQQHLENGLKCLLDEVRYNTTLKTAAALYTDRVYVPCWELLKAMLTGDGIHNNSSPYHWVSWEQTDNNFTALVSKTSRRRLEVELFSHASEDRQVVMRLWQFEPGKYNLRCEVRGTFSRDEMIIVQQPGQRIDLTLPSRRLVHVRLQREP